MPVPYEAPVQIINPEAISPLLLIGDHACNTIPPEYDDLGLPPEELSRHIAYDIGTAGVLRALAEQLNAPAVLCGFSRLLIDPNRGENDPTLVMRLSDGAIIPGNRHIDAAEINRRIVNYHRPYRQAVKTQIERAGPGRAPAIFSIHSFTPQMRLGQLRPWHISVLWEHDDRLARPLLTALRAQPDLCVGENEPYRGVLPGDSMDAAALSRGAPFGLLEIRNDLISGSAGQAAWAARLAPILAQAAGATERAAQPEAALGRT